MSRWRHSVCELDWIAQRSNRGPLGDVISVDRPTRVVTPDGETPDVEKCCVCGAMTIVGIYVRGNPDHFLCGGSPQWGPVHDRD
jgi:hypothetical protein